MKRKSKTTFEDRANLYLARILKNHPEIKGQELKNLKTALNNPRLHWYFKNAERSVRITCAEIEQFEIYRQLLDAKFLFNFKPIRKKMNELDNIEKIIADNSPEEVMQWIKNGLAEKAIVIEEKVVDDDELVKPFLKWAGGKLRIFKTLKKKFPTEVKRYIEPFVGAGSVALNVDYPEIIVNDTQKDLISVYEALKNDGVKFIADCKKLFKPENNKRERFDALKKEFNNKSTDQYRRAILFIYLNRHCFNGLCRFNSKGEYNVPFGKYDKPYCPDKELENCLEKVKKFKIYNKDFREIFKLVKAGDVVYCDPPYVPVSTTAHFASYDTGGFGLKDHFDLAKCAAEAAKIGTTVIISNHYNFYTKELYEMYGGKIVKMNVARTISSKAEKREPITEIIAIFKKDN